MPIFNYRAKQPGAKKEIKSEIEASSEAEANKLLIRQGYIPISVKEKGGSKKGKSVTGIRGRIRAKDKVLFSRQLSTLINAGLPLVQSLRTVENQTQNKALKTYISRIVNNVEGGDTLSNSMKRYPDVFSTVYTSLVQAGEISGTLDDTLERLANQQEKDAEITSKVKGAMIYPMIVLAVIGLVVVFMLTTVLPQVELLYKDLGKDLPAITKFMLTLSKLITRFWWLFLLAVIGFIYAVKTYVKKTEGGRTTWDRFKIKIPIFGKLMKKLYMARFARTGQTLMASSVPMLQMMDIAGLAVNNTVVQSSIGVAADKVKGGSNLGIALEAERETFLPLVSQMINVGEKSGNIDIMMGKAADYYEKELDNEVKTISTTIEPLLMVVLAVVAGGMVGAILLPVYGLVGESVGVVGNLLLVLL